MGLRVLLADDNMTAQNQGKKILTEAGYDVVTVSNGLAAGKKIAELHPDVALLDVYMPGYSGVEICERTKATPETAQIPVLLMVGKMEPFRAEEGARVKADGLIVKPFEAQDLISILEKLTGTAPKPKPPAPASVSVHQSPLRSATADFQAPGEVGKLQPAVSKQAAPKTTELKPTDFAHPAATPKIWPPIEPSPSRGKHPSSSSHPSGGETCDVCGHVNVEGATVCQECDVPLPSSVLPFKGKTARLP